MAEDTGKTGKAEGTVLKRIGQAVILLSVGLLGFLGKSILTRLEKLDDRVQKMEVEDQRVLGEVASIKDDNAKWAALASLQEQTAQLRIQTEVMIELWKHRDEPNLAALEDDMVDSVAARLRRGKVDPVEPKATPEALREQYEQRYPNEPAKK